MPQTSDNNVGDGFPVLRELFNILHILSLVCYTEGKAVRIWSAI